MKELKIAKIDQLNQLFKLLRLVHIYSHGFYELRRKLMRKNVNNDVGKESPIIQRNNYFSTNYQARISTSYIDQTILTNSTIFAPFIVITWKLPTQLTWETNVPRCHANNTKKNVLCIYDHLIPPKNCPCTYETPRFQTRISAIQR